jgi:hypothetical protein
MRGTPLRYELHFDLVVAQPEPRPALPGDLLREGDFRRDDACAEDEHQRDTGQAEAAVHSQ